MAFHNCNLYIFIYISFTFFEIGPKLHFTWSNCISLLHYSLILLLYKNLRILKSENIMW